MLAGCDRLPRGGWTGGPLGKTKHGHAKSGQVSPEYRTWKSMVKRCHDPGHMYYARYGPRGITVCQRWRESFEAFLADVGPRPSGCSLDRVDNDRGYGPENCRWADRKTQARNRRSNRLLTLNGVTRTLIEWAQIKGVIPETISMRIKAGWSVERALTEPVRR